MTKAPEAKSEQSMPEGIKEHVVPRIMIAAAGSDSGKTTITCGLLQALLNRRIRPASFKCGPDYIDPMFHSKLIGIPAGNLDLYFTSEATVKYLLGKNAAGSDLAVLEGVMGYYDGLAGNSTDCSSYDLAVKTQTPVILTADCRGMSVSVAALIKGFLELRSDHGIRGVILNRIPPTLYSDIKTLIEKELPVEVLGYLPHMDDCRLESRHLGLVTAGEIGNLKQITEKISKQMERSVDLDRILEIASEAPAISFAAPAEITVRKKEMADRFGAQSRPIVKIAVAMDKAFCFYYRDNLELLEELGAEIVPFSPLKDQSLPESIHGLILGGGYPELYLPELSANRSMLQSIRKAVEEGVPCLAECGGFMYLHQQIKDQDGTAYQMVGVLEGESYPLGKLSRFGYLTLTAREDNLLCGKGDQLKGHEFHYWDSTDTGRAFYAEKPIGESGWDCIVARGNLFGGYPHVHFYSNIGAASEFIKKAAIAAGLSSGLAGAQES